MPYDIAVCLIVLRQGPPVVPKLTVSMGRASWPMSFCKLPVSDPNTRAIDSCGHAFVHAYLGFACSTLSLYSECSLTAEPPQPLSSVADSL